MVPEAIALWRIWTSNQEADPRWVTQAFSLTTGLKNPWRFQGAPATPALACGLTSSWERWKKRAMSCTRSYLI